MIKNQKQKEHTPITVEMQVVMPLEVGMRIPEGEPVRVLMELTERLDYGKLRRTYERPPRKEEATEKQLFQLTALGFMNWHYATRALEHACRYDIRFQYILAGKRVPDHTRFARFIKEHLQGEVAEDLFYQQVLYLFEMDEIAFENMFPDGTKIEANANRYSFVWEIDYHTRRLLVEPGESWNRSATREGVALKTNERKRTKSY